ncbi:MAG: hypothetical protein AAF570_07645 [Bacteroidota bacterium]
MTYRIRFLFSALPVALLIWIGYETLWAQTTGNMVQNVEKTHVIASDSLPNFWLGGIQMNEPDMKNWVRTIQEVGMNTVEVTVYAQQGRWNENNLWFYDVDPHTLSEIRAAHAQGLRVILILRLQLDHAFPANKFLWHGQVLPENDYFIHRWFEQYTRFVRQWARVAEQENIDVLVLGSEMNALASSADVQEVPNLEAYFLNETVQAIYKRKMMRFQDRLVEKHLGVHGAKNYTDLEKYLDDRKAHQQKWAHIAACTDSIDPLKAIRRRRAMLNYYWERLIEDTRRQYSGLLSYAANFDNYMEVGFWDRLDLIGINAYFPLRNYKQSPANPKKFRKALQESWEKILQELLEFRAKDSLGNRAFLFTELGYGRHAGATLTPWQGFGYSLLEGLKRDSLIVWDRQPDFQTERNMAVRTLHQAVQTQKFPLAGLLYWKLTTLESQLKYDPFALHLGKDSKDTLQSILGKFSTLKRPESK